MDHENIVLASVRNTFETQRKGGSGGKEENSGNLKKQLIQDEEQNSSVNSVPLCFKLLLLL
jgi:hypothetical protein